MADNMATFYPAISTKSKFDPSFTEKALPQEYQAFFDRYESVIFISFGTMFMPTLDQMMKIVEVVEQSDGEKVGYILSL